jgi:uncharacterized protein (TIGR02145 family)
MIKKYLTITTLTAALFLLGSLIGCTAEGQLVPCGGGSDNGEEKIISLRIVEAPISSRGISASIPDKTPVQFNTGDLYLITAEGTIIQHYRIETFSSADQTAHPSGVDPVNRRIHRDALKTNSGTGTATEGVRLPAVPRSVSKVVIVGNTSGNATTGNIKAVGERLINVINQHNATTPGVNLWGEENLTNTSAASTSGRPIYEATVTLKPTVARFEIANIRSTGAVTNFTVAGIFIDKYYRQAQTDGVIPDDNPDFASNGTDISAFQGGPNGAYSTDTHNAVHDWSTWVATASGNPSVFTAAPATGTGVWSYQLFAEQSVTGTQMPNIVIRLSSVTVGGTVITEPRFITINQFFTRPSVGDTEEIKNMHAGNIYRIPAGAFLFSEKDLSTRPNDPDKSITVTVEQEQWDSRPIIPESVIRQPHIPDVLVCAGREYTFLVPPATGGRLGSFTYIWQSSTDDGVNWTPIFDVGRDNPHFTINSAPTLPTIYRRLAIPSGVENDISATDWNIDNVHISNSAQMSSPRLRDDIPEYVEIAGIKWATLNLDAPNTFVPHATEFGMFYQYNRNVGWSSTDPLREWVGGGWVLRPTFSGVWNNVNNWDTGNDWSTGATNPCPTGWRLPTAGSNNTGEYGDLLIRSGAPPRELAGVWVNNNQASELFGCLDVSILGGRIFGENVREKLFPNDVFTPHNFESGAMLFFPVAGVRFSWGSLIGRGGADSDRFTHYWSSSPNREDNAYNMTTGPTGASVTANTNDRAYGYSIRCVKEIEWDTSNLPGHYMWGNNTSDLQNNGWTADNTLDHWLSNPCTVHPGNGGGWRLPSADEFQALLDSTPFQPGSTTVKGFHIEGQGRCLGPNANAMCSGQDIPNSGALFFPYAGRRWDGTLDYTGSFGYYWSSTPHGTGFARTLYVDSGRALVYSSINRAYGYSVRCVR